MTRARLTIVQVVAALMMTALFSVFLTADVDAKRRKKVRWKTVTHKVKKGDTLSQIAMDYGVTVRKLQRWNKKLDPTKLQIGQRIRISVKKGGKYDPSARKRKRKVAKSSKRRKQSAPGRASLEVSSAVARATLFSEASAREGGSKPAPTPVATPPKVVTNDEGETIKVSYYKSQADENLGSIALKLGVDVQQLQKWNGIDPYTLNIPTGTQLTIRRGEKPPPPKGPVPATYTVRKGDTFLRIAKRLRVSTKKLKKWNRKVKPSRLSIGQKIRYYTWPRDGRSRSVGSPNRGRLVNGVPLESTWWLKVRYVSNAYGTRRVTRMLKAATADVAARWPESERLVVGDISFRRGGRIKKHKSHQSGRDADISYYHRGDVKLPDFRDMSIEAFDAAKNWHIFKTLIDTGQVRYIFVDYTLQRPLYEYARSIGYTAEELDDIIQYPRPRSSGRGTIRHTPGHDDHWHIRFTCGENARGCHD
jgi:LysM repeat protein